MLLLLAAHAKALDGPEAHREALRWTSGSLALQLLVLIPLAFHAGYGVWLASRSRLNVGRYPSSRNWTYTLQRVSGLLALLFIALYAVTFWLPAQRGALAAADLYATLQAQLSSTWAGVPWLAFSYVIGVGACCFHLANGLSDFCVRWGLTRSARARARAGLAFGLFGLLIFGLGLRTIVFMATGWRVPASEQAAGQAQLCGNAGDSAKPAGAPSGASPTAATSVPPPPAAPLPAAPASGAVSASGPSSAPAPEGSP